MNDGDLQCYLVGGAVRDALLGLDVDERDWVVVGATPAIMRARGFRPVDAEFPVFVHPGTGEEYALARRERKLGEGYRGFAVDAGDDVTLEEDLRRRDLTINAMAEQRDGSLIDPYGGRADLDAGRLRHVSPAFDEDPLRVLRVARFAAKLGAFDFRIAHPTHRLMRDMVARGDMQYVRPERLWREMSKALQTAQPWRFFEVLHRCGALRALIPTLAVAMGAAQAHGSDVDSAPMAALKRVSAEQDSVAARFAAVFLACRPPADALDALVEDLRADRASAQLLRRVVAVQDLVAALRRGDADALYELIRRWRGLERDSELDTAVAVVDAQDAVPLLAQRMPPALAAARAVSVDALRAQGIDGAALGRRLDAARRQAVRDALGAANLLP